MLARQVLYHHPRNARKDQHTVETGMRAWQSVLISIVPMDIELAEAVHSFKFFKSVEWNFTGAGDKLE